MIKGTTSSGFKYEINENIKKDWRFVSNLTKLKQLEDSDSLEVDFINVMAEIESIIFSDKGKAFEKHIMKNNEGIIPTDVVLAELMEIIKNDATKNS